MAGLCLQICPFETEIAKRTEHGVFPTQEYYPKNTHRSQIHFQLVQCLPAAAAAAKEENSAQTIRNLGN